MKKMLYRLSLLLVVVSLVLPAIAEAEPARAAPGSDRGFLTFLNALQQNPVPMAAAAKGKGPGGGVSQMALCTASASCGSDPGLYCEDHTNPANCVGVDQNCPQRGYVTCDGVTTWCPECPGCSPSWCTGDFQCYQSCYPCAPIYTCYDYPSCTDYCDCQWSTCPP